MSEIYKSIMAGLKEVVDDAVSEKKKLRRRVVTIVPVKKYTATEIKMIRNATGMSQKLFAGYLGVSDKTVEAWEAGINIPSGTASRLLTMLEMDGELVKKFPFVQYEKELESV